MSLACSRICCIFFKIAKVRSRMHRSASHASGLLQDIFKFLQHRWNPLVVGKTVESREREAPHGPAPLPPLECPCANSLSPGRITYRRSPLPLLDIARASRDSRLTPRGAAPISNTSAKGNRGEGPRFRGFCRDSGVPGARKLI